MKQYPTIIDKFCEFENLLPQKLFLAEPVKGLYQKFTWQKAGNEVRKMAAALQKMGLGQGDKVAILSKNCAHWIMADLAIAMAGCISVPLYPNITAEALHEIIIHSESKAIFIGKLDKPEELRKGVPEELIQITFPFYPNTGCLNWDELVSNQEGIKGKPIILRDGLYRVHIRNNGPAQRCNTYFSCDGFCSSGFSYQLPGYKRRNIFFLPTALSCGRTHAGRMWYDLHRQYCLFC
jgi:hypothetical protein